MMRYVGCAMLACAVSLGLAGVANATTHVVNQVGFTFDPAEVVVQPGDTVEWHWQVDIHTVTSGTPCTADGLYFDEGLTSANPTVAYVIPDDGTTSIPYFCRPHCISEMTGTITIQLVDCPNDCSGHGVCESGACICDIGWSGEDCSEATPIPTVSEWGFGVLATLLLVAGTLALKRVRLAG